MSNTAPVENAQSSDASHATIAASSSTRTKRPFGIFDSMKSMCCCVSWSKIAVFAAAGVTAVDQDVVLGEFLAERLGQRDQAGLRGRIMRGVGVAFLAGDRGDVDDAAVFLREHRRHHRLAADEGAVEIDAQHLAPFVEVGFPHRLVDAGDAGIVDEDVDLAERLQRLVAGLLDRGEVGDVDLEGRDRRADFLGGLFRKRQVMIPDRDLGAGSDEALGDGAPKPLRPAGDDGATAVQIDLVHGSFCATASSRRR